MPDLSICMSSNRDLAGSRRAIESALAYCGARDAVLIVADNSGDPEKREWLKGLSPRLIHIDSDETDFNRNVRKTYDAAATDFIMPMGDDDVLLADGAMPAFDLKSLPEDHVGVYPVSVVFSEESGELPAKSLALDQDDPGERISAYISGGKGNNSFYHSIFRREIFDALTRLFLDYHPTKGVYCDWAISMTLAAYGKMAHDPGTVYRYNLGTSDTSEKIARYNAGLYRSAGLPEGAEKYERLLMFLDLYIMATRKGTPLLPGQTQKLSSDIARMMLSVFVREVAEAPQEFDGTLRYLIDLALDEKDSFGLFQLGLMMADSVQPGLKNRYVDFVRQAMAA